MNMNFSYTKDLVEGNLILFTHCPLCGSYNDITIKRGKEKENTAMVNAYISSKALIQEIFTDEKCAEVYEEDAPLVREFFISGICDKCFKQMQEFEEEDDEEFIELEEIEEEDTSCELEDEYSFEESDDFDEELGEITSRDLKEYMTYI